MRASGRIRMSASGNRVALLPHAGGVRPSEPKVTPSDASKQILVVDDDPAVLRVVQRGLTAAGYDVTACERFESAKDYLAGNMPDILLSDWRLGAFQGLQLGIPSKVR